ncbi:hypothetical protein BDP27DRAFT_327260 [Rhodocollybia butyracea]|uniref:Transmembrane protein n=1 Tax=Rhodocollybia butyracea TaxID=206335 RepID=A0A9P5PE02_9AGAR|nr:hypothetical protein BDP27DRAFT_327260 [Rhodocollybia butyracea]
MSVKLPISNEPVAANSMDFYNDFHATPEKHSVHVHSSQDNSQFSSVECPHARRCHASRLKRVILILVSTLISLGVLVALSCVWDMYVNGSGDLGLELMKRVSDDSTNSGNGAFVDHKLYLIIVFVGLLLVVILGICLSAWCCRGSFENPLCCPCYLCACCGGLACLECIACGLCAEGVEQM